MQFCYTEIMKGINYELWAGMGAQWRFAYTLSLH